MLWVEEILQRLPYPIPTTHNALGFCRAARFSQSTQVIVLAIVIVKAAQMPKLNQDLGFGVHNTGLYRDNGKPNEN